jgi:hypothetical protein
LFRKGPNLPLQDRLVQLRDMSFNTLVSAAIEQEGTYRALLAEDEEKGIWVVSGPSKDITEGDPPKYHLVYTPSASKYQVPSPPTSATADVTTDTCPVSSVCITSCTSAEDRNR